MNGRHMKTAAVCAVLASAGLIACSPQGQQAAPATASIAEVPALAQTDICVTQEVRVESGCKPGQRVVFMPARFGNEQLPVMFASMNCDLRYAVAMTNGGVTCIYLKARAPQSPGDAVGGAAAGAAPAPSAPTGK